MDFIADINTASQEQKKLGIKDFPKDYSEGATANRAHPRSYRHYQNKSKWIITTNQKQHHTKATKSNSSTRTSKRSERAI